MQFILIHVKWNNLNATQYKDILGLFWNVLSAVHPASVL